MENYWLLNDSVVAEYFSGFAESLGYYDIVRF